MPRLPAIEKPKSLYLRIVYWFAKRELGKVITPMKVIYARKPDLIPLTLKISNTLNKKLVIPRELVNLITTQSSFLNDCAFCKDLHLAEAIKLKIGTDKFKAISEFKVSPHFSPAEKAALAYTEEVTRNKKVMDSVFAELKKHFSDEEIVEITWVNAVGNYFNLMAAPLQIESDQLAEIIR